MAIVQDGLNKEDFLSTLKLVTKPIPKAGPGQVVVHITMRPVNPTDLLKLRRGQVADGQKVTGSEGYGIVHEVRMRNQCTQLLLVVRDSRKLMHH